MNILKFNKILGCMALALPCTAIFSFTSCSPSKDDDDDKNNDVAILFTNDTHCTLESADTGLGWSALKSIRNWLESKGTDTLLVDSGDYLQGGVYGTISEGSAIVDLMNACEYDVVIPGNHEFDYGMEVFNRIQNNQLKAKMISSNFYHYDYETKHIGDRVLPDTAIVNAGEYKIGFVGVTTPNTMLTTSPSTFKDSSGNQIYTFLDKDSIYKIVQESINSLKNKVDFTIALTHLGIGSDGEYADFNAESLIKNTTGLTAVLDGHSHTYQTAIEVQDQEKNNVYLAQTGTNFQSIGLMTINDKGDISFGDITSSKLRDKTIDGVIQNIHNNYDGILNEKIKDDDGNPIKLDKGTFQINSHWANDTYDMRIARDRECSGGDFIADSFLNYIKKTEEGQEMGENFDKKVLAVRNGGSVRSNLTIENDDTITLGSLINVQPFANNVIAVKISGKKLKEAFEKSICYVQGKEQTQPHSSKPKDEFGGFLQVSHNVELEVDLDDNGVNTVTSLSIGDEEVDLTSPEDKYILVGPSFTLAEGGDGYDKIFPECEPFEYTSETSNIDINVYEEYLVDVYKNVEAETEPEWYANYKLPNPTSRIIYN